MSKFLGPIHYWLHSKITLLESIEVATESRLSAFGYDLNPLKQWDSLYEAPNPNESLESVINQDNIHGWLQRRIGFAETRFAGKITTLQQHYGQEILNELHPIFESYAIYAAKEIQESQTWDQSLDGAHKLLHNHILEGMPCDHAGAVTINENNLFQWKSERCLHQTYWSSVNGDVQIHYELRDTFNNAFLKALGDISYSRTQQDGIAYYQLTR